MAGAVALSAVVVTSLAALPARAVVKAHLFQQDQCADCHLFTEREGTLLRKDAFRRDVDTLCVSCHERERLGAGHRVGMTPSMLVPADLPLDPAGRLTCATCHDPHALDGRRWFLRRPPGKAFCDVCHPGGLPMRAPPAVTFVFPPDGAVLAAPETVVAGTVESHSLREVVVRTAGESRSVPVVSGSFAARVRLVEGPNVVSVTTGLREASVRLTRRTAAASWSPHLTGDVGQCAVCHPRWEQRGFFTTAAPGETCHSCHERVDGLPHTHRPSALGECTLCHDPHGVPSARGRSCDACHDGAGSARHLLAVNERRRTPAVECLSCHDPHQSTRPALTTSARESLAIAIEATSPAPRLSAGPDGATSLEIPGFAPSEDPGRPRLPERILSFALPPGADPATARLTIVSADEETLPGRHTLAPAPPFAAYVEGRRLTEWGGGRRTRGGRDTAVYEGEAPWPSAPLTLESPAAGGPLALVRVAFHPVRYRPATGRLTFSRRVVAEVSFLAATGRKRGAGAPLAAGELGLANVSRAASWAGMTRTGAVEAAVAEASPTPATAPYLVVTTNAIAAASAALGDFTAHKAAHGLAVRVVTEDDYGATAVGPPRAHAIRAWLGENSAALSARYLLLVGNPHPETGDVPMLRAWPRRGAPTNPEYADAPTDAYYADLSGDWDLDGDGYYGEFRGDGGTGGVDFVPELYVGRIPVYSGGGASIDPILRKVIAYESEAGSLAWRRTALLPMSFSDAWTDGARLAEQMKAEFLLPRGFAPWTLYQQGSAGGGDSVFTPDEELRGGTVASRWSASPYGLVVWWGHGSGTRTLVGYSGAWDGDLLAAPTTPLNDASPAFVFQTACLNGLPESESNLGYSLLRDGAIATVAASRVSWYAIAQQDFRLSVTNAGIGYRYAAQLAAGAPAGQALGLVRGDPAAFVGSDTAWMNLMDFNLYGDPSVGLFPQPVLAAAPGSVALTAAEGESEPLAAALALSTGDASAVALRVSTDAAWLTAAPAEGQTPATLALTALPSGLAQGRHQARALVESAQATNGPLPLPVTLTVTRPGRIHGRVTDPTGAPVAGAAVTLQGVRSRAALADEAGAYFFAPLPPGRYTVSVTGTSYRFARSSQAWTLAEGEVHALSFAATSYAVRGRVLDARGAAIPKVAVRLFDPSGVLLRQVLTDARGAYAIGKLGPGGYRVAARRAGWHFRPAAQSVTIVDRNLGGKDFTGLK